MKITDQHLIPFGTHPEKDEFFFAPDNIPFYTEADAQSHANELLRLKKATNNKVFHVTRAMINTWKADTEPGGTDTRTDEQKVLADAQGQLDAAKHEQTDADAALIVANNALTAAQATKAAETTDTTTAQKSANTKAVNATTAGVQTATDRVNTANQAVTDAQVAFDKLSVTA